MAFQMWAPYVPVHQRRANAARELAKLAKKGGFSAQPVRPIEGRAIAHTFWGRAWCDHLERYSDFDNRLPRGRTYVRNGSVVHLEVQSGVVHARVSGSSMYTVKVEVEKLAPARWQTLARECQGSIGSLVELLEGRLSKSVMEKLVRPEGGLFPLSKELKFSCSCPDWASMCKHVAATLYGVGSRLDAQPELLFLLRAVDHSALIAEASAATLARGAVSNAKQLDSTDLGALFGIEMDEAPPAPLRPPPRVSRKRSQPQAVAALRVHPPQNATSKLGTIAGDQLTAAGIAPSLWRRWIASGALLPTARPGVYLRTSALDNLLVEEWRRGLASAG